MQHRHRHRHRLLWLVLGPLALILLLWALIHRPQWPAMGTLPGTAFPHAETP